MVRTQMLVLVWMGAGFWENHLTPGVFAEPSKIRWVDADFHSLFPLNRRSSAGVSPTVGTFGPSSPNRHLVLIALPAGPQRQAESADVGICCARLRSSSKRIVLK